MGRRTERDAKRPLVRRYIRAAIEQLEEARALSTLGLRLRSDSNTRPSHFRRHMESFP